MPEQEGSVQTIVRALASLEDSDVLAVVRALAEQRPALAGLIPALDLLGTGVGETAVPRSAESDSLITDAEVVDFPDVTAPASFEVPVVVVSDDIIDVPVSRSNAPVVPEPDYTDGGVPTFDRMREKIEGRYGTSLGATEMDRDSPAGKSADRQWDDRQKAARAKLDEIRRSMGKHPDK